MVLLTQCYYHPDPLVFATCDPTGMLGRSRCVLIISFQTYSTTHVQRQGQSQ